MIAVADLNRDTHYIHRKIEHRAHTRSHRIQTYSVAYRHIFLSVFLVQVTHRDFVRHGYKLYRAVFPCRCD